MTEPTSILLHKFSPVSEQKLSTCDERLHRLFLAVLPLVDHTILCGFRNEQEQNAAFLAGRSRKHWPDGKHNSIPSKAVDAAPYPIDFEEKFKVQARFYFFAGIVKAVAQRMEIKIRWGGDWDGDVDFADQTFDDLAHFELVEGT